jgi:hypothetical protein
MRYELVNLRRHSIYLEDINVRFDGVGSRVVIDSQSYNSSKSLKDMAHCFKITKLNEPSMPWPFDKSPANVEVLHTPSVNASPISMDTVVAKLDDLITVVSRINTDKIDLLIDAVNRLNIGPRDHAVPHASSKSDDFVYIPSQIIPENAETSLTVRSSESIKEDIDESVSVLKKMRKKNA